MLATLHGPEGVFCGAMLGDMMRGNSYLNLLAAKETYIGILIAHKHVELSIQPAMPASRVRAASLHVATAKPGGRITAVSVLLHQRA